MAKKPSKRSLNELNDGKNDDDDNNNNDEPASKRIRLISQSEKNGTPSNHNDELKHHTLTQQQINDLPCLLNPSLFKAVFDSFRIPRKIPAPKIEFTTAEDRMMKCNLNLHYGDKTIQVSGLQKSKSKAELECFQKLCYEYIPYQILQELMKPYSLWITQGVGSVEQISQRIGEHLKNKTSTIVLLNAPLRCDEMKVFELLTQCSIPEIKNINKNKSKNKNKNKNNDDKNNDDKNNDNNNNNHDHNDNKEDKNIDIRDLVEFIYFSRVDDDENLFQIEQANSSDAKKQNKTSFNSDVVENTKKRKKGEEMEGEEEEEEGEPLIIKIGEISQRIFIQFINQDLANHFVEQLNGKIFQEHKLAADWAQHTFPSFEKLRNETNYVMISGWPEDITQSKLIKELQNYQLNYKSIMVNYRYSIIPYCILQFKTNASAQKQISQWLKSTTEDGLTPFYIYENLLKPLEEPLKTPLFVRFATKEEYHIKRTIKSMFDSITRKSNRVKVSNVAWNTTEKEITDMLSAYGKIEEIQMCPRKDMMCGYVLVTYDNTRAAHKAILQINGLKLKGYPLQACFHVKQSKEDKKILRQLQNLKEQELAEERKEEKKNKLVKRKEKNRKRRKRKKKFPSQPRQ